jgi:hypothetical protein
MDSSRCAAIIKLTKYNGMSYTRLHGAGLHERWAQLVKFRNRVGDVETGE